MLHLPPALRTTRLISLKEWREDDPRGRQHPLLPDVGVHVGRGDEPTPGLGRQRKRLTGGLVVEADAVAQAQDQVVNLELAEHHHAHRLAEDNVHEAEEQVDQNDHHLGLGRREGAAQRTKQNAI
ncbi:transcription termination factor, putative [Babesia ovata]|uniref:Transcription termination factor, putative n=1 Tax=Babesia ovata TaxID=189622 RepID=A0A2H6KEB3_9APIC|nr:transcription termination factor, putative [Babesia ovata]GBE61340.1 transcription termination factor, putative [Babesia ovata]